MLSGRRPRPWAVALVMLATLAAACAGVYGQVRPRPTRQWLKHRIVGVIGTPDSAMGREWRQVRDRSRTLRLLEQMYQDPTEDEVIRDQALKWIGATGQAAAYEFLAREWDAQQDRVHSTSLILGLGSGPHPAVKKLGEILASPHAADRMDAAFVLGEVQLPAADSLLRARLAVETSQFVRGKIEEELAKPRRQ